MGVELFYICISVMGVIKFVKKWDMKRKNKKKLSVLFEKKWNMKRKKESVFK